MEKVRGMGLKPFVIIFFNPLAEARGNGWNCLYREQFLWTRHKRGAFFLSYFPQIEMIYVKFM
jgi:hypothetical protein